MDDLISRQAALDAVEWKWAGKAAIDAIKALPSAQPDIARDIATIIENEKDMRVINRMRWIPVSERPPELGEDVLVQTKNYGQYIMSLHIEVNEDERIVYWKTMEESVEWDANQIVAWMPLPEPYCGADMRGE